VAPIFILGLAVLFRKSLLQKKKSVFYAIVVGLVLIAPLIIVFFRGGQARFQSVTTLTPQGTLDQSIMLLEEDLNRDDYLGIFFHNRRVVYVLTALKGYLDHFDLSFLFITGDGPARHHSAGMGVLYQIELPFILLGMFLLIRRKKTWAIPVFLWYFIAPLASAITSGTPHAVRALLYLPTYQIFTAYGVYSGYYWLKRKQIVIGKTFCKSILVVFTLLFLINITYYIHMYYIHTPIEYAHEWQYGYKEVVQKVRKYEDEVENIIVTYTYDQPYIYFLFYNKVDPKWYQVNWGSGEILRAERKFGKYSFRNIDWENDKKLHNVILVGSPGEIPKDASGKIADISFPDGSIAFRIVRL